MATTITDRLLESGVGYNTGNAPTLNLKYGGQFGYAPSLDTVETLTPFVDRDVTIIVYKWPEAFKLAGLQGQRQTLIDSVTELFETHPYSVTGFNAGTTLETAELQSGFEGQVLKPVVKSTKAVSDVTFNYRELELEPFSRFCKWWMDYLIQSANGRALISTIEDIGELPLEWNAAQYSVSYVAFQTDAHFSTVTRAWDAKGVHPLSDGEITASRTPTEAKSIRELSIPMTGYITEGPAAEAIAQQLLDQLNVTNANPFTAGTRLTEDEVQDVINDSSYAKSIESVRENQI